jgi:hypothetical protein
MGRNKIGYILKKMISKLKMNGYSIIFQELSVGEAVDPKIDYPWPIGNLVHWCGMWRVGKCKIFSAI